MVRSGTQITFEFSTSLGLFTTTTIPAVESKLASRLSQWFRVFSVRIDTSAFDVPPFELVGTVALAPRSDYGSVADIASVVANAVYQETGYFPTVSAVSHGEPGQPRPESPGVPDSIKAFFDGLKETISGLGVAAIVVVVGAFVMLYVPIRGRR